MLFHCTLMFFNCFIFIFFGTLLNWLSYRIFLCRKDLTHSSIYTHLNTLKKKTLENIVERSEIAQNEQFPLFYNVFYGICMLKF